MRNAKIICTLGPATDDRGTIRELADAGMSIARLNASHGTVEDRRERIHTVRQVDDVTDEPLAVMLDTQGPEVRTAEIDDPIQIETDARVEFAVGDTATPERIGLSNDITAVEPGDVVLLDDGRIETRVEAVDDGVITASVVSGGTLGSRKGVNVPGVELDLDIVTEKDRRDLRLAAEENVDFVAASFVRSAEDVYEISSTLEEFGADIPIIAKIERAGAVENLDEIIDAAYGVMVARGDLGVECPMEDVPVTQKRIIRKCRNAGSPVITATEMLDSMVHSRRPTRAEASDVANAVLDGTDGVMLSAETAVGDDPVHVVETMDRIVREAEASDEYDELREQRVPKADESRTDALARSARYLARDVDATAVVVASESGYTARKAAKFRPAMPVVATTPNDDVRRQLALSCGVAPQYADYTNGGASAVIENAVSAAIDAGVVESGDTVVVISGMMTEIAGTDTTNTLKVHVAAETVATGRSVVGGRVSGPVHRVTNGDLADAPDDAIAVLSADFEGELEGDLERLAGVISADTGLTGYAAMVARELDLPMVGSAALSDDVADGDVVTIDGERGVVYAGSISGGESER
ncbi:pyruvate kinase [Halarchaeum solikamskense]|uniref:pyruvate kinase n=1 Tax=Halarchaeum nitratireducens TaxID=489913 RepID=UPI001B3AB48E|nr:pyruvate kinase [Halarchaeum solikamskense]MBP2251531.1 pyruvate kinase [Halarchaeum solikamskense]